ncbi:hypothetical protein Angca_002969 [Angiostrongylus cantonensis]|nr:hypothetical protein Angca_002969 [Angiostrongylus cantonensis]
MDLGLPTIPDAFYTNSFPILVVDNYSEFGEGVLNNVFSILDDTLWSMPSYGSITMKNVAPLFCYTLFWCSINLMVSKYCWTKWKGFRRQRLINLTTSLVHSTVAYLSFTDFRLSSVFLSSKRTMVTGCYLIVYLCRNTRLMFASPLHYYSYLEMQLVLLSMGYFIYDAIDMLINDILNASYLVLMFHHISALYFLSFVPITHKFLLYSYWALLMEVSSIFLHCRSLLNQSKLSTSSMVSLYSLISYVNIVVFVIFRFLIQLFPFVWVLVNMHNMYW